MNLSKIKKIAGWGLNIFFIILAFTGFIKFIAVNRFFGIGYISLPSYWINSIHDWSGVITILFAIIFFSLRKPNKTADRPVNQKTFLGIRLKIWYLIIILFIVGAAAILYILSRPASENTKQLQASEVTEYQGEKLSSTVDLLNVSIKGTQNIDIASYKLEISGLVDTPKEYTYDQTLAFQNYSKVVQINCVEGWSAKILWEGILLKDLLNSAGIQPGANTVIFYAADGYSTSLPLDYILNNDIILANKINGVVLPPEKGFPFQLVAEDKWGYKWIKWLTRIEVSDNPNYKGTYEQAGYSESGDLNKPQFETGN